MHFTIDPEFLTSVSIKNTWDLFEGKQHLTDDELIMLSMGHNICSAIKTTDHPEFTRLREQLALDGYIKIERGWWNGDRTLKLFRLNGHEFEVGSTFACAEALRYNCSGEQHESDSTGS